MNEIAYADMLAFEFDEVGFVAQTNAKGKKEMLLYLLPRTIFYSILVLPVMILFFVMRVYSLAIIGVGIEAILMTIIVRDIVRVKRQKDTVRFQLNQDGVSYIGVRKKHFISWDKVASFGIVNHNAIWRIRAYKHTRVLTKYQTCLYFSQKVYEEKEIRKKCAWIGDKPDMHLHSDEFIVLSFWEDNVEAFICQEISKYLHKYSDKSKEVNYVNNLCTETKLTCCDAQSFEVQVAGEIKHSFPSRLRLLAENGCVGGAGKCKICGKRKVFFERTNEDFPMRKTVSCPKCGANDFSVRITKEYIDTVETIDLPLAEKLAYEGKGNIPWMKISLTCNECKKTYERFFDSGEL